MSLPFDSNDPVIRRALHLIRLQVLTPVSVLINITTCIICALVINPSMRDISNMFPNTMTPKSTMIGLYWMVVFGLMVFYSLLIVVAKKDETKKTIVDGVGLRLVFVNWLMAAWAVSWVLQWFLASTIFLSLNLLLLLWINISLLSHPAVRDRPLDTLAIHVPLKLFLVITLLIDLPQSLFITLGWTYPLERPNEYMNYQWEAFGVIMGTNMLGLIVVLWESDLVWAVGGVWSMLSLISRRPKAAPVFITCIVFAVLYPTAWVLALIYKRAREHDGRIALPADGNGVDDPLLRQEIARVQAERIVDEENAAATADEGTAGAAQAWGGR